MVDWLIRRITVTIILAIGNTPRAAAPTITAIASAILTRTTSVIITTSIIDD